MPILISRKHNLNREDARQLVNDIARDLSDSLRISYSWNGDRLDFHRLGLNGYIDIQDHEIIVHVQKSFFVPVSDNWIREKVEEKMDEHLE